MNIIKNNYLFLYQVVFLKNGERKVKQVKGFRVKVNII